MLPPAPFSALPGVRLCPNAAPPLPLVGNKAGLTPLLRFSPCSFTLWFTPCAASPNPAETSQIGTAPIFHPPIVLQHSISPSTLPHAVPIWDSQWRQGLTPAFTRPRMRLFNSYGDKFFRSVELNEQVTSAPVQDTFIIGSSLCTLCGNLGAAADLTCGSR